MNENEIDIEQDAASIETTSDIPDYWVERFGAEIRNTGKNRVVYALNVPGGQIIGWAIVTVHADKYIGNDRNDHPVSSVEVTNDHGFSIEARYDDSSLDDDQIEDLEFGVSEVASRTLNGEGAVHGAMWTGHTLNLVTLLDAFSDEQIDAMGAGAEDGYEIAFEVVA